MSIVESYKSNSVIQYGLDGNAFLSLPFFFIVGQMLRQNEMARDACTYTVHTWWMIASKCNAATSIARRKKEIPHKYLIRNRW